MIICHARRFIFVDVPKTSEVNFRISLADLHDDRMEFWGVAPDDYFALDLDRAHLRLHELSVIRPDVFDHLRDYCSIAFVRNPYLRFVASFRHFWREHRNLDSLLAMTPFDQLDTLEHFIETELKTTRVMHDHRFVHFSPQAWFIGTARHPVVRHLVPIARVPDQAVFEAAYRTLQLPLTIIEDPDFGFRDQPDYLLRSQIVRRFIARFYSQDFEIFRSLPSLRHLAIEPTPDDYMAPMIANTPLEVIERRNVKTHHSHPFRIDEIELEPGGVIGMSLCPGKQQNNDGRDGAWASDFTRDIEAIVAWRADVVITLMNEHELLKFCAHDLPTSFAEQGISWLHMPIEPSGVPDEIFDARWAQHIGQLLDLLGKGGRILVHCRGGRGRTGLVVAKLLIAAGFAPEHAAATVSVARAGAMEEAGQAEYIFRSVQFAT